MEHTFKPGDIVYVISPIDGISTVELSANDNSKYPIKSRNDFFTSNGYDADYIAYTGEVGLPLLLPATTENYQALVTLYGEDEVPELPLRGSELTKKLLEKQKYVICCVSDYSDERAREWPQEICVVFAVDAGGFTLVDGGFAKYAVPVDEHGHEITEIE